MGVTLDRLFAAHAAVTFAAAVVLVAAPAAIPATVGIRLDASGYLLCYLLAGCEFGVAYLSFASRRLRDGAARRVVSEGFIVLHLATAAVEAYAWARGASAALWANVALRVLVAGAFAYWGVAKGRAE